jgi:hypothetical protein
MFYVSHAAAAAAILFLSPVSWQVCLRMKARLCWAAEMWEAGTGCPTSDSEESVTQKTSYAAGDERARFWTQSGSEGSCGEEELVVYSFKAPRSAWRATDEAW